MDTTPLFRAAPPDIEHRFQEPADFQWGVFTARDGARLRWGRLPGPTAKACILVCGFMEFIEKYFETARDFQARGYDVWCLDWRDQGRSQRADLHPTRPAARDYDRDAEDLTQFISAKTASHGARLLAAHSMGAAIGLSALHTRPRLVDAAVLSAPMLAIKTAPVPLWAARLLARTMVTWGRGARFIPGATPWADGPISPATSRVSHDPARCRLMNAWFAADPRLQVDGPTFAWLDAALAFAARVSHAETLAAITTPLLIGSAGQDALVVPAAHRHAAALLPTCRLVAFPDARHELFHETDGIRSAWFTAIDEFAASYIEAPHLGGPSFDVPPFDVKASSS